MRVGYCVFDVAGANVPSSESDLTDVNFFLDDLDTSLFPGTTHAIQVHNGFAAEHAKTANTILTEVKRLLSQTGAKQVITASSFTLFTQNISS